MSLSRVAAISFQGTSGCAARNSGDNLLTVRESVLLATPFHLSDAKLTEGGGGRDGVGIRRVLDDDEHVSGAVENRRQPPQSLLWGHGWAHDANRNSTDSVFDGVFFIQSQRGSITPPPD